MLGSYDGKTQQTTPDGQTILGSIVNDKSQNMASGVTLDYYNNQTGQNLYIPFFVPNNDVNA